MLKKLICVGLFLSSGAKAAATDLTVLVHDSFNVDKTLLAQFESQNNVSLKLIKGGDAGQMLNKLILSSGSLGDVVYGIDNTLLAKATQAGVLVPNSFRGVDLGYVALNYDKATFKGKTLPKSLNDLTKPQFKGQLVVQNPATSSPGLAFLLSTVKFFGPEKVWVFWAALRDNDLKVTKGWTDAYETEFSKNGGTHPIVVSYASSPAAEVFYSDKKLEESPTGNLFLPGSTFKQLEGIALVKGGKNAALGKKFIEFMRSSAVQNDIPTQMWVYPVIKGVTLDPVYQYAQVPKNAYAPKENDPLLENTDALVQKWVDVVIKGK